MFRESKFPIVNSRGFPFHNHFLELEKEQFYTEGILRLILVHFILRAWISQCSRASYLESLKASKEDSTGSFSISNPLGLDKGVNLLLVNSSFILYGLWGEPPIDMKNNSPLFYIYMCVYVCIYICISMYVCMYVCMCVCITFSLISIVHLTLSSIVVYC